MRAISQYSSMVVPQMFDEHHRAPVSQLGKFFANEAMHANSLQPDRIQHAGRCFDNPRRRMSFSFAQEQAFDRDPPQQRQVDDVGVLDAVSEATTGGDQRIDQPQRAE